MEVDTKAAEMFIEIGIFCSYIFFSLVCVQYALFKTNWPKYLMNWRRRRRRNDFMFPIGHFLHYMINICFIYSIYRKSIYIFSVCLSVCPFIANYSPFLFKAALTPPLVYSESPDRDGSVTYATHHHLTAFPFI